jgi:hypothetical protein
MASTTNMILSFAELDVPGALASVNVLATTSLVLLITSVVVILFAFLISQGLGCCRRLGCKGALFQDVPAPPPSATRPLPLPGHSAQIEMAVVMRENPVAAGNAPAAHAQAPPPAGGVVAPALTSVDLGPSATLPVFALAPAAAGSARDVDDNSSGTILRMTRSVRKSLSQIVALPRLHSREREHSSAPRRGRLPAGWEALRDSDGRSYFHELASGETTYTHPSVTLARKQALLLASREEVLAPPRGWSAHTDPETGKAYYSNALSGETCWEAPPIDLAQQVRAWPALTCFDM